MKDSYENEAWCLKVQTIQGVVCSHVQRKSQKRQWLPTASNPDWNQLNPNPNALRSIWIPPLQPPKNNKKEAGVAPVSGHQAVKEAAPAGHPWWQLPRSDADELVFIEVV